MDFLSMIDAVEVQFLQPIFEDDFVERGMKAYLTGVEEDSHHGCYHLYFDFAGHYDENLKYFKASYYDKETREPCRTAIETGNYPANHKYSVYFGDIIWTNDVFNTELSKHIKII